MSIDMKVLNKIYSPQIQQHTDRIIYHDQVDLFQE